MSYRLRPEAQADIEAIALYIYEDNPAAARRWLADMEKRCERLGRMPGLGVARPDVRPNLRMLAAGSYIVLYQKIPDGVEIVRVVHGARRWQDLV